MACRVRARPERRGDLVVGQVVAVTKHDGCAFRGRQSVGQLGKILVGWARILRAGFDELGARPRSAERVEGDVLRDRQNPGTEMLSVLEAAIRPERTEERLLEGIVGSISPQPTSEQAEHLDAVLLVEPLERGDRHGVHHRHPTHVGVHL